MVKTNRPTLHSLPRRAAVTRHRLSRRTAATTRGYMAARNRRRKGFANIQSDGPLPHKHSPDGAT